MSLPATTAESVTPDHTHFIGQTHGSRPVVLLGDFNNNTVWDTTGRPYFQQLSDWLTARGLISAYHAHTGETNGRESQPTHWSYRDETKPHHIDYAFLPAIWDVVDVSVGDHASWAQHSDHALLTVEVRVPNTTASRTPPDEASFAGRGEIDPA